jgi:hypothetical protein
VGDNGKVKGVLSIADNSDKPTIWSRRNRPSERPWGDLEPVHEANALAEVRR